MTLLAAFDALASTSSAREGKPDPDYLGLWTYTVTSATETTFEGRALSDRCPQPDIRDVPNMPGLPGTRLRPAVGAEVGVMFLDGDPSRPRVVTWDQTVAEFVGLAGADAAHTVGQAIHRVGDHGTAGSLVVIPPSTIVYTDADGNITQYTFTLIGGSGSITIGQPIGSGSLVTKATEGSQKASSG